MLRSNAAKSLIMLLAIATFGIRPALVHADVIGAEAYLSGIDRRATIDRIDAVLAREEIRDELERLGVDAAAARERVAALNDQELLALADDLEQLPAGGSVVGTIGVVFIVLLILELTGVIDIFKKI